MLKGSDRALVSLRIETTLQESGRDQTELYLNARYISASEAFRRNFGFPILSRKPPIDKRPCHLLGENTVTIREGDVLAAGQNGDNKNKKWRQRKQRQQHEIGRISAETLGRNPIYSLKPCQTELFHLRMLLHHVRGAKSFSDLKRSKAFTNETYEDA